MKTHANIPIFIPHEGCQNACVFCNQRTITGTGGSSDRDIVPEIEKALSTIPKGIETEIAFFGGSFTGIGIDKIIRLCDAAYSYVKRGKVKSVRLSTRPDYISKEILEILKSRGVVHIELGIQSMVQRVLDASKRGHTVEDTENACRLIKEYGFVLGGQMMLGLPKSSLEEELYTAKKIVDLGCDEARIYPCVVFENTELCSLAKEGIYTPLTVEAAVTRGAKVLGIFKKADINVLRIGLQAQDNLNDESFVYAGANHPSLGEMIEARYFLNKILDDEQHISSLARSGKRNILTIFCSKSDVSKISGHNRQNKKTLLEKFEKYGYCDIKITGIDDYQKGKISYSAKTI